VQAFVEQELDELPVAAAPDEREIMDIGVVSPRIAKVGDHRWREPTDPRIQNAEEGTGPSDQASNRSPVQGVV
jgi:hypothetical protein